MADLRLTLSMGSAAALLLAYRWWRHTLSQRPQSLGLRDASQGVGYTYSKEHPWWLEGQRFDFKMLFNMLGEDGIREISQEFYRRVYCDEEAPWFRDMFIRRASLQQSVDRQAAFFVQMWGGPKVYTANNKPHCLRHLVSDHAGLKFFAMHENVRSKHEMTHAGGARWLHHMHATLVTLRPSWATKFGEEEARMLEKTIRWFADHGLENIVQGGPAKQMWHPARIFFRFLMRLHMKFVDRNVHYPARVH